MSFLRRAFSLLALVSVAWAAGGVGSFCAPSTLEGYTCMQSLGGSGDYTVHWAVPDATTVKMAAQAQAEGWISLGESVSGRMLGETVVQGSSEGVRSVQLNSYSPSTFAEVSIPGVAANDVVYQGADGTALIEFSRTVEEGADMSVPLKMIGAYHSSSPDMNAYHSSRFMFTIDLLAEPSDNMVVEDVIEDTKDDHHDHSGHDHGDDDDKEKEAAEDSACRPSGLPGFECSLDINGALLHWSFLPSPAGASVSVAIHALQESSGWLSAGFPSSPGSGMVGAHVLHGSPSSPPNKVVLGGYSASLFSEAPSDSLLESAVTDESINVTNGATTLYFTINGDSGVDIRAPVSMIVAWNTRTDDLSSMHSVSDRRAFDINFLSGEESAEVSPKQKFWLLHGALMFLGWGLLIPAGVTAASSFKHEDPAWIKAHRALNAAGLLMALAGFVVAIIELRPFFGEAVVSSHAVIGCVVMALGCIQPVMAYFRPGKTDPNRVYFNYAHWSFGFSAVILGLANCATGTYLLGQLNSELSWAMIAFLAYLAVALITYAALRVLSATRWSKQEVGAKDSAAQAEAGAHNSGTEKIKVAEST